MNARPSLLSIAMVIGLATSSTATGPAPLTLQAAIDEALSTNPELVAIRAALDARRLRPPQEDVLAPPMIDAQIWQWPTNTLNPGRASYMITLQQAIPGAGKRSARAGLARADVDLAGAELAARAQDIVAGARREYAELFVARRTLEITRERIDLLRQVADATQVRYAAGRTPQQDVLKAVVEISRLHEQQLLDEERARLAETRLNTLLGREPGAAIGELADVEPDLTLAPVALLQSFAVDRQPDLRIARAGIARAEAAMAVAETARTPDVIVTAGYMAMGAERNAITAGLGITWPNAPWSRKGVDLARHEARAELAAARARGDAEVSRVRGLVQQAWIRADSAARRALLLRTSIVPQSQQALEVSRVGYQADRGAFLDIVDNQRVLAEARLAYYQALIELEQARADLERAVGGPIAQQAGHPASQE
jgi:cobalt-zinc-cadmium efflux system outer membrane protein